MINGPMCGFSGHQVHDSSTITGAVTSITVHEHERPEHFPERRSLQEFHVPTLMLQLLTTAALLFKAIKSAILLDVPLDLSPSS